MPGNPSVKADTDDRILIETNVPIRKFISHIHCLKLAMLICMCPFFFPLPSSPSESLSPFPCFPNLFIITQGRQLMCSIAPNIARVGLWHALIASFKSEISQDKIGMNT